METFILEQDGQRFALPVERAEWIRQMSQEAYDTLSEEEQRNGMLYLIDSILVPPYQQQIAQRTGADVLLMERDGAVVAVPV